MCTANTLESYISLGSTGCEIGASTFSGFEALPPITGALPVAPGNISITPVQAGNMVGLDIMINATAIAGQVRQSLLGYMVMAPAITSTMVTLSGTSVTGGAFVTDIQNYCGGGAFLPGDVTGCTGPTNDSLVVLNAGSQQATFPAVSTLNVVHDLTLDAFEGGTASGGMVMDRFTVAAGPEPIPEPRTYVLLSSALLAIALRARSRSRAGQVFQTGGQHENV
jgi:hypothetical protein